jgi:hypothetical protein
MKFEKNKDEAKNLNILKKEIAKMKNPYSQILVDSIFSTSDPDEFRNIIKSKVSQYIESKITK